MKKKLFFSIILSIFLLIPFLCQASVIVLTKKTPNYTIPTGSDVQIVGTGVSNQIILESGARAELISFPGQNTIQIQSISDLFTVFCSGKVVTFQGTDGTVLKIPAREDTQIIAFMDRTFELAIYEDNVMINDQVIGVENKSITEMFGGNIGSFRSIETQDIITDDVTGVKYVIGQVMIVPEIGVTYDQLEDVVESFGGTIVGHIQFVELFQVEFPGMFLESLYEILEQLNQNPFVKVAVINTVYSESADQSITENWLSDPWNEDPSEPFSWEIYPGDDVYPTNWAPEGNNAAVESMRMPEAWKIAHDAGMGTVKVGIIDSDFPVRIDVNGEIGINGINGNVIENLHEDLEFVWANQSGRKKEKYQHGHHVAGTIGALNNNVGIRGVAWNPNLYGYRTDHSTSDMLYAICSLILEKKVGLINISMNTPQNNDEEQKSTRDYLREKNESDPDYLKNLVNGPDGFSTFYTIFFAQLKKANPDFLIVQSAGNFNFDAIFNPFAAAVTDPELKKNLLVVGAYNTKFVENYNYVLYNKWENSCYGPQVDIFAPGGRFISSYSYQPTVYSTVYNYDKESEPGYSGDYDYKDGTSMAAPHITGLAALIKQTYDLSWPQIKEAIIDGQSKKRIKTTDLTYDQSDGMIKEKETKTPVVDAYWAMIKAEKMVNEPLINPSFSGSTFISGNVLLKDHNGEVFSESVLRNYDFNMSIEFINPSSVKIENLKFLADDNTLNSFYKESRVTFYANVDPEMSISSILLRLVFNLDLKPIHYLSDPVIYLETEDIIEVDQSAMIYSKVINFRPVPPDTDADGIIDGYDACPFTPLGEIPNEEGCSISQLTVETESPPIGDQIPYDQYLFTWKPLNLPNESTLKYFFSVQKDSEPNDILFRKGYSEENDKFILLDGFEPATKYFWHVWAVDQNGVWSKAKTAGEWSFFTTSSPPSPTGYSGVTQSYDDGSYYIAFAITGGNISSIDVLDGPNIVYPTWDNHASLSDRPEPGDIYTIRINYTDRPSEETSYIVEGVNENPAVIISPQDFEIIDTTQPTIEWQQVTGTSSGYSIVIHKIEGGEETPVWISSSIAPVDTSCVFNFDNKASELLQPGGTYKLYLHSYDDKGNQATSTAVFIIESIIFLNIQAEYQAAHGWNFITWNAFPGAVTYQIYWGTEPVVTNTSERLKPTDTTEYQHTGVLPGSTYYYRIASVDSYGNESELSEQVGVYCGVCGAYVAPGVWKQFDCYNLAAIGKTTGADPFTPSWELIGGYWQWGKKGPDPSVWYNTNTPNFAHGPTGPGVGEANEGPISTWETTPAPDGAWSDSFKTANDPCPAGFRVPTISQWQGVINSNILSILGTWSISETNYSSAQFFGSDLMLPATGSRDPSSGSLFFCGYSGEYWSSSEYSERYNALNQGFYSEGVYTFYSSRLYGFSVRCIAEDQSSNIILSKTEISLLPGVIETVSISGGTAYYTVSSDNSGIATAFLNGSNVEITGISNGAATITVEDTGGSSATIAVTVLSGTCGAYIAPDVWKEFDCYNLAAIGKTTGDDPFTPSWRLIGGYWQWGKKGPDPSVWYNTNTPNFAHGPTGPGAGEANEGPISTWDTTPASDGAWSDSFKTANDPCPAGFRVPTISQWQGVINNNTQSTMGTWASTEDDHTNYSIASFYGSDLMLPAAGYRHHDVTGALYGRGSIGYYWSSTENSDNYSAWYVYSSNAYPGINYYRRNGFSIRCVAE